MMFLSDLSKRFDFFCGMSQYPKQMELLHKLSIIYIFAQCSYCIVIPIFFNSRSMLKPSHQPSKCGECLKTMLRKNLPRHFHRYHPGLQFWESRDCRPISNFFLNKDELFGSS